MPADARRCRRRSVRRRDPRLAASSSRAASRTVAASSPGTRRRWRTARSGCSASGPIGRGRCSTGVANDPSDCSVTAVAQRGRCQGGGGVRADRPAGGLGSARAPGPGRRRARARLGDGASPRSSRTSWPETTPPAGSGAPPPDRDRSPGSPAAAGSGEREQAACHPRWHGRRRGSAHGSPTPPPAQSGSAGRTARSRGDGGPHRRRPHRRRASRARGRSARCVARRA